MMITTKMSDGWIADQSPLESLSTKDIDRTETNDLDLNQGNGGVWMDVWCEMEGGKGENRLGCRSIEEKGKEEGLNPFTWNNSQSQWLVFL